MLLAAIRMPSAEVRQLLFDGEIAVGKIVDAQVPERADAQAVLPAVGQGGRDFPFVGAAVRGRRGDDRSLLAVPEKQYGHPQS